MLELRNLSFSVDDGGVQKEIIHDLSITIDNGKFVVITGPNGSGKSTLARLIMGIEKPTSGKILFDGQDITDMGITERVRQRNQHNRRVRLSVRGRSVCARLYQP